MGMWLDPRVKAVIGGTGGYGAVRMIPFLEPQIFESNPKAFVGYSDITALHLWLMRWCWYAKPSGHGVIERRLPIPPASWLLYVKTRPCLHHALPPRCSGGG